MFFGAVLKVGETCVPTDSDGGDVLHLSQVCLVKPTSADRTYLEATHNGKTYTICVLQKDKIENVSLELFISCNSGIKFQLSGGKNEVHLTGYFEPSKDDEDLEEAMEREEMIKRLTAGENESDEDESDESDDEENEDDEKMKQILPNKSKVMEKKPQIMGIEDEDEDEDEDDDDESGDDNGCSSPESTPSPPPSLIEKKKETKQTPTPPETKKRRADEASIKPSLKGTKQQKTEAKPDLKKDAKPVTTTTSATGSSAEAQWEKAIVDCLRKTGRQQIAVLAAKVKKPDALKQLKYGAFLKSKSNVFVVEGGNVSLKN